MRVPSRAMAAAAILIGLTGLSATFYSIAQDNPQPPDDAAVPSVPSGTAKEPTVTVLDKYEAQGILGREVRSAAGENMGRIVDVLVDRNGQVRAAVIDFGGFLGVGSRKIAVAWNALRFPAKDDKNQQVALELTRDQVRAAPEYKGDKSVVVLGASGNLESLPF